MSFAEADLPGLELCPHGERRKFCPACNPKPVTRCVHDRWSDQCAKCHAHPPADIPVAPPLPDLRTEWMIEAECTRLLEEDGWRALRTDPVSDRGRGKGFGELGMSDHLYIRYCPKAYPAEVRPSERSEVIWIEFKSAKGKPKKHQIEWNRNERARGALTLIAGQDFSASVEGFKSWYASSGLMRRQPW